MQQALGGFAIIWLVIGLGWILGHVGVVSSRQRAFLNDLAFLVASPALLFTLVSGGSLTHLFSRTLFVSVAAIAAAAVLYLASAWLLGRRRAGDLTVGALCACYTNAGNLGLPIAIHLLGDGAWMAPIMLLQVGILQPAALAILDARRARADGVRLSPLAYATLPFRNPITVGILLGLAVNLLDLSLPGWLMGSLELVGGMAIPMMLVAFGVSLRLDPLPGRGPHVRELWVIQLIKVVLMPAVACGLALAAGLPQGDVFAVTVIAALPTAQNVYVISSRYAVRERLARDSVFWSTILSVPSIVAISALLG